MLKAITNKIRLLRLRSKEPYSIYYQILGFLPNDLSIYEQAFLHRSASAKTEKGRWVNNERLEFLGDAILDSIIADILFRKFENKKEGFLTNTRSKIVQRDTLNKLAVKLGLDKLVVSSTKGVSHNNYMYGNAFEAFVGAIYIDQGYDVCKRFIEERVIAPYLDLTQIARKEVNFKSKLIEWSQKNKAQIEFLLIESFTDSNNNPVFQTQVVICGLKGGIGTGYSKKESQQNAAKSTLKKLKSDQEFKESVNGILTGLTDQSDNRDINEECHTEVENLISAMTTEWVGDSIVINQPNDIDRNNDNIENRKENDDDAPVVKTNETDIVLTQDVVKPTDPGAIIEEPENKPTLSFDSELQEKDIKKSLVDDNNVVEDLPDLSDDLEDITETDELDQDDNLITEIAEDEKIDILDESDDQDSISEQNRETEEEIDKIVNSMVRGFKPGE